MFIKMIIKDFLKFLWKRDSDSACMVIITLAGYLNKTDARDMKLYLAAIEENLNVS